MHSLHWISLVAIMLASGIGQAQAQSNIICWKDKAGKVVGCGDKVPPEYQDNATQELNRRGVTVKQSAPALTPEQKKTQQAELERKQAEDQKKQEQRRRDKALLDTFSNVKEIDLKRARDVQLIESNIETLQTNLKNANERQSDSRVRIEQFKKKNQPVPPQVQEEFDRIQGDKAKIQAQIEQKRKDIVEMNQKYDDLKKRFIELRGGPSDASQVSSSGAKPAPAASTSQPGSGQPATKSIPTPAPAPATSTAPAKK